MSAFKVIRYNFIVGLVKARALDNSKSNIVDCCTKKGLISVKAGKE